MAHPNKLDYTLRNEPLQFLNGKASPSQLDYTLRAQPFQGANPPTYFSITAANGSFTLTGEAATLNVALIASQGSFTLTGEAATLNVTLSVSQGLFTLTGEAATLAIGQTASSGTFTLTGEAANGSVTHNATSNPQCVSSVSATGILSFRVTATVHTNSSISAVATISHILGPIGFTDEALGTPQANTTIRPTGFTDEAFGPPVVSSPVNVTIRPVGIMSAEFFGTPSVFRKTKEGLLVVGNEGNDLVGTYAVMGPKRQFIKLSIQYGRTFKEDFKQSKNVKVHLNRIEKNQRKRPALSLTLLESNRHGKIYDIEEQGRTV